MTSHRRARARSRCSTCRSPRAALTTRRAWRGACAFYLSARAARALAARRAAARPLTRGLSGSATARAARCAERSRRSARRGSRSAPTRRARYWACARRAPVRGSPAHPRAARPLQCGRARCTLRRALTPVSSPRLALGADAARSVLGARSLLERRQGRSRARRAPGRGSPSPPRAARPLQCGRARCTRRRALTPSAHAAQLAADRAWRAAAARRRVAAAALPLVSAAPPRGRAACARRGLGRRAHGRPAALRARWSGAAARELEKRRIDVRPDLRLHAATALRVCSLCPLQPA